MVGVVPRSHYVPRGAKTIDDVAFIARKLDHNRVMAVESTTEGPKELRFLEVDEAWRWINARVELGKLKLKRDIGRPKRFDELTIFAEGDRALKFARWVGKFLDIGCSNKLPDSGVIAQITSDDGLKLLFRIMPSSDTVGPSIEIKNFGPLRKE